MFTHITNQTVNQVNQECLFRRHRYLDNRLQVVLLLVGGARNVLKLKCA